MTVLEELRDEREKEVIGQDLASLLARVAAATAKTYPPDYSPAGVWNDEAIEDVLQDWTEDRLLRRKDLSKLLAGARSEAALRAGLTTSIGQHLTNRRRRSAAANLYKRMQRMLRDDDAFEEALATGAAADRPWTVSAAQATVPSSLSEAELVPSGIRAFRRRSRGRSLRAILAEGVANSPQAGSTPFLDPHAELGARNPHAGSPDRNLQAAIQPRGTGGG